VYIISLPSRGRFMPGVTVQTQTLIKVALKSDEPLISLLTEMVHLLDEDRYLAAGKLLEQVAHFINKASGFGLIFFIMSHGCRFGIL
jgi:hypothetical protein